MGEEPLLGAGAPSTDALIRALVDALELADPEAFIRESAERVTIDGKFNRIKLAAALRQAAMGWNTDQ